MDLTNRHGIITGAGQGIGQALALDFAAKGAHLLLVGRTEETLQKTAELVKEVGGTSEILVQDLGQADAAANVAEAVKSWDTLDLLVNNAGNVRAGRLEDATAAEATAMIDLNLTAPVLLTQALLPRLRTSGAARGSLIVNISSEIALVAMPFYAVYAATKSGLAAFGEAMRRELHGTGVHVSTVYPGATDTEMMSSQNADWKRGPVSGVVDRVISGLSNNEYEINATHERARSMQELNHSDPLAVDAAMADGLADMEAAVKDHNSI
ncbi:SDR family NAD(P)-dependent oxidoreductase [Salinibacterium sp. NG253]|uniref:SDR family NAD(P)-dependent oxidoreductase n=1 Tax=Salinibacterium sp. NG253 TaxID=2792039 RepID=UPI0018CEAFD7|nr:SDR family NAD(P)-dependent oxidoreductase [Salinibacterium sp. NG253]MBH0115273.1 SDR family NAD(P)-dependent oxidoreductase [Salinibacterium sp. NG253]